MTYLPPITNPDSKYRSGVVVICPVCKRAFHPWKGNLGQQFCTPFCAGKERTRRWRVKKITDKVSPEKRDQILADCKAAYDSGAGAS